MTPQQEKFYLLTTAKTQLELAYHALREAGANLKIAFEDSDHPLFLKTMQALALVGAAAAGSDQEDSIYEVARAVIEEDHGEANGKNAGERDGDDAGEDNGQAHDA